MPVQDIENRFAKYAETETAPIETRFAQFADSNPPAVDSQFNTQLNSKDEAAFQSWIKTNRISDLDHPDSHYDYRGYWKEFGGKPIKFGQDHFTDTYKKPGHPTFSNESKYAVGDYAAQAGRWEGDTFIPPVPPVATPPLLISPEHEQQRQSQFNRQFDAAQAQQIRRNQSNAGPTGVAAITAIPPEQAGALESPVSKKLTGYSVSDIADSLFPETQRENTLSTEGGSVRLPNTVYDMARRSAKMAAGVVDWIQTPVALAAAATEAISGGAATPVIVGLLGARFATVGGQQALGGLEDIRKNGINPENAEVFFQGLLTAEAGLIPLAGRREIRALVNKTKPLMERASREKQQALATTPINDRFSKFEEVRPPEAQPETPVAASPRVDEPPVTPAPEEVATDQPAPETALPAETPAIPETAKPTATTFMEAYRAWIEHLREFRNHPEVIAGNTDAHEGFLARLRSMAEQFRPEALPDIDLADQALEAEPESFVAHADRALASIEDGYNKRLTLAAAEKQAETDPDYRPLTARLAEELGLTPREYPAETPTKPERIKRYGTEAEVRSGTRGTTLWLSQTTFDLLGERASAMALTPINEGFVRAKLRRSTEPRALDLIRALDDARARVGPGRAIKIVKTEAKALGRAELANIIRHETAHERSVTLPDYASEALDAAMQSHADPTVAANYQKARQQLAQSFGYPEPVLGNEIVAFVTAFDPERLGLTRQEVLDLAVALHDELGQQIGIDKADDVFAQGHPAVKRAIRAAAEVRDAVPPPSEEIPAATPTDSAATAENSAEPTTESTPPPEADHVLDEIPTTVQRFEPANQAKGSVDLPQGLYTSPRGTPSPYELLNGGEQTDYQVNPEANILVFPGANGFLTSGQMALNKFLGFRKAEAFSKLPVEQARAELRKLYPTLELRPQHYPDSLSLVDVYGAQLARDAGYDAMSIRDHAFSSGQSVTGKDYSEFVALTKNAFQTPETIDPTVERMVQEGAQADMLAWSEMAAEAREAQKGYVDQGRYKQDYNAEGAATFEDEFKDRTRPGRSSGVKEGSPLADFEEPPSKLKEAIDKGTALEKAGKTGKGVAWELYQRIKAAFADAHREQNLEQIQDYVAGIEEYNLKDLTTDGVEDTFDFGENVIRRLDAAADQVAADLKAKIQSIAKGETLGANLPVDVLVDLAKYGAIKIAKGTVQFAQWSAEMLDEYGEQIRPHLGKLYRQAFAQAKELKRTNAMAYTQPAKGMAQSTVGDVRDTIRKVFSPASVSRAAGEMGLVVRRGAADLAARNTKAAEALRGARNYFSPLSEEKQLEFIHAVETGNPQGLSPIEGRFASQMRQLLDRTWDEVRQRSGSETVIEDYFPHLWADPGKAEAAMRKFYAKRPMQGGKRFLKRRKLMTVREGLDAGLTLAVTNPVDMVLAQLHQEHKFITGHDMVQEMKDNGLVQFRKAADPATHAQGLAQINDPIGTVYGKPTAQGGRVILGHWMAPESAARIVNNYLGPGLAGNVIYDFFRATGNVLNQVQLGASAFHFTFTVLDTAISRAELGLRQAVAGNVAAGAKNMVTGNVVTAPFITYLKGSKVLREFYRPGSQGEYYAAVIDDLIKAGGRVKMDSFYKNSSVEKFWNALDQRKFASAIVRAPLAALEYSAKPLMEHWVPRMKLGIFADLSRFAIDELGPTADPMLVRKALAQTWDSVDNRMGQLVYDNLFWSRTLKDLGMVSVRSLGWNLGTWRELGGAGIDLAKAAGRTGNAFQSGTFRMTPRMGYALTMPVVVGLHGALLMYMMTGKGPSSLKDYFYPQTGKTTPNGDPERVALPSYAKDLYAIGHDLPGSAVQTMGHKLHPELATMYDMLRNEDFFGTEIRHEDDPLVQQLTDSMKYIGSQYVPFSIRNMQQRMKSGGGTAEAIQSFVGLVPAPKSLEQTPAERLAQKYAIGKSAEGARTKEQFERSQTRNAIIRAFRADDPTADAQMDTAFKADKLTISDLETISMAIEKTPLERTLQSADLEQVLNVWDRATKEEKRAIAPLIETKLGSKAMTEQTRNRLTPRAEAALAEDTR